MTSDDYLIVPLLLGFEWFDEALQSSISARGGVKLTRPESMVMIHVIRNIVRPADIARSLGLTRQAVHTTISQIVEKRVFELHADPTNPRIKIVALTELGKAMRRDAQATVAYLEQVLAKRIGARHVKNLKAALAQDWGTPVEFPPMLVAPAKSQAAKRASSKTTSKRRKAGI